MQLFRLFHLLILGSLGLVIVFFLVSAALLARPSVQQIESTKSQLAELLQKPATLEISATFKQPETVQLKFGKNQTSTNSASLLRHLSADEALFLPAFQPKSLTQLHPNSWYPNNPRVQLTWDETRVREFVASFSASIDTSSVAPKVTYSAKSNPVFSIYPGKAGSGLNEDETVKTIIYSQSLEVVVQGQSREVDLPLSTEEMSRAQTRVNKISTTPLAFTAQGKTFSIPVATLAKLINLPDGYSTEAIEELLKSWAGEFDLNVVEPELAYDGKKITTFKAPIEGRKLDLEKNKQILLSALTAMEEMGDKETKELVVNKELPKVSLESLNDLGISERIGRGDSDYAHSIPNRIFNVSLASTRIHGFIIRAGETFSFNKALGEVSAATGFKQAYVIERGQTILGDGGGVCQVSSTFFRALLDAGLPILERRGHSYRVGYYEQNSKPGFDATVSGPRPDLTFLNDTGAPILVNAQADSKKLHLTIELYGKLDGRKSEILDYKQWDNSPAPAPIYQDDPTLPAGTLKQIDYAAGGLKTSFQYRVTYKDGTVKNTTYATTYVPWRAVFLRGTR